MEAKGLEQAVGKFTAPDPRADRHQAAGCWRQDDADTGPDRPVIPSGRINFRPLAPMTTRPETGFEERVRDSLNRQNAMRLLRATLPVIRHGMTEIHLPHWAGVEQQPGFVISKAEQ